MTYLRSHYALAVTAYVVVAVASANWLLAGRFDQVRSEVEQPAPVAPPEKKKHPRDDDHHDDDDDHHHDDDGNFFGDMIAAMLCGICSSPFRGQPDMIRYTYAYDDDADHLQRLPSDSAALPFDAESYDPRMYFARSPYHGGIDGYMMRSDYVPVEPQIGAGRIAFVFSSNFNDVDRWAANFLIEHSNRWGLDGDWNYYTERLAPGLQDNLKTGDINILYRFVEREKMQWRIGAGVNWFDSRSFTDLGINLTTKLDYYPVRPIVISGEVDYGQIGNGEQFHGNISAGVMLNRFEFFTGYDYRKIGPIDLEGPMFGVRLWW